MSKPKNKIFCHDCNRPKILFETEKKAELFIKYNADEIGEQNRTGKKPVRAYYCQVCGGWHVTSSPVSDVRKYTLTDRVLSLYHKDLNSVSKSLVHNTHIGDFQYIGLFLTDKSKEILKNYLNNHFPNQIKDGKMYLDHCTILHRSQINEKKAHRCCVFYMENAEKDSLEQTVRITKIGFSDKAFAFGCTPNTPCVNKIPHITVCTFGNGKPVDSNSITYWHDINPFSVKARLDIVR